MKIYLKTNYLVVLALLILFGCNPKVDEKNTSYSDLKAYVVSKSNRVLVDDYLQLEVIFNRMVSDSITVDFGDNYISEDEFTVQKESILIKKKCKDIGLHKLDGKIFLVRNGEKLAETEISYEYIVSPPVFNVVNRNLCYEMKVNTENEIEVSVQGVIPSDINITCNNGKILKNDLGYVVIPSEKGECKISVMIMQNGEMKNIGERIFTVK